MKKVVPIAAGLVGLSLLLASGCRRTQSAPPPDAEQARQVLGTALDAWKRGENPADLQKRDPAMHVADFDWQEGWKLQSYKVLPGQEEHASSLRVKAALTLHDPKGNAAEKKVAYLIGTSPKITIVREFE